MFLNELDVSLFSPGRLSVTGVSMCVCMCVHTYAHMDSADITVSVAFCIYYCNFPLFQFCCHYYLLLILNMLQVLPSHSFCTNAYPECVCLLCGRYG
jgi:hypothetical protein